MKITPTKIIQIWNTLSNASLSNDSPFSAWMKRFYAYAEAEVKIWNGLSEKERVSIADKKIELPLLELKANQVPDNLPLSAYDVLSDIVKGELKKPKSQIEKLLEAPKEEKESKKK